MFPFCFFDSQSNFGGIKILKVLPINIQYYLIFIVYYVWGIWSSPQHVVVADEALRVHSSQNDMVTNQQS